MEAEFARNKAVVRVTVGIRYHFGVKYILHVTLAHKDKNNLIYHASVFLSRIRWYFNCWKTVFVIHICCSSTIYASIVIAVSEAVFSK